MRRASAGRERVSENETSDLVTTKFSRDFSQYFSPHASLQIHFCIHSNIVSTKSRQREIERAWAATVVSKDRHACQKARMNSLCGTEPFSAPIDIIFIYENAGSNNASFNGRTVNWQKTKRIKERVAKKRAGVAEKHKKAAVVGVSGVKTKKHQRRVEHKARIAAKEAAQEAGLDAAKKKEAAAGPEAMQE
jgi:hypothetical protein